MTIPEMMSQVRLITQEPSELKILGFLKRADLATFEELHGLQNPDIEQALQKNVSDSISVERPYVVLPSDVLVNPEVFVADENGKMKKAQNISLGSAQMVKTYPSFKPAAMVQKNKVTIFPSGTFKTGTRKVNISYFAPLGELVYIGGFRAKFNPSATFGIKGKADLPSINFIFPEEMPEFTENQLVGAVVSFQMSDTYRKDYLIEEHPAGALKTAYVSEKNKSEYVDLDAASEDALKGYSATIHKTSDLPEKFHHKIVQKAIVFMQPSEKSP